MLAPREPLALDLIVIYSILITDACVLKIAALSFIIKI